MKHSCLQNAWNWGDISICAITFIWQWWISTHTESWADVQWVKDCLVARFFTPKLAISTFEGCLENITSGTSKGNIALHCEKGRKWACTPWCQVPITADIYLRLLQSHLTWEWLLIISFPTGDKSQTLMGFYVLLFCPVGKKQRSHWFFCKYQITELFPGYSSKISGKLFTTHSNLGENWQQLDWIGFQKMTTSGDYFSLKITDNLQRHKTYLIFSLDELCHL